MFGSLLVVRSANSSPIGPQNPTTEAEVNTDTNQVSQGYPHVWGRGGRGDTVVEGKVRKGWGREGKVVEGCGGEEG